MTALCTRQPIDWLTIHRNPFYRLGHGEPTRNHSAGGGRPARRDPPGAARPPGRPAPGEIRSWLTAALLLLLVGALVFLIVLAQPFADASGGCGGG